MKKVWTIISAVLGLGLFIAMMAWVGIGEIFKVFGRIRPLYFLVYIAVSVTIFFGFVLRWWIILRVFKQHVPLKHLFFYRTAGYAVSYLTPFAKLGGEPVMTYFLAKDNVTPATSVSSVIIDKTLELTANVFFSMVGLVLLALSFTLPAGSLAAILWGLAFFIAILVIFYYRMILGRGFFTSIIDFLRLSRFRIFRINRWKIRDAERDITNFFNQHRKAFILCMIISLALYCLTFLEFNVLMWVFGYNFPFTILFWAVIFIGIATLFPFPAALGSQEAGQVTLFQAIGSNGGVGMAISLITRFKDILWTLVGTGYMYHKGLKKLIKKEVKRRQDRIKWNF